jgi:ubiquinone/menaquinone biosynthesis C-methylase UbiE
MVAVDYLIDDLELALNEIIRVTKSSELIVLFSYKKPVLKRFGVVKEHINYIYYNIFKNLIITMIL